ncbi:hypothetical protein PHYSODRAFT_252689 [Phytophthora sojae]|uniref:Uncharacterized protein n=1 Tax=Phytophthora sojae (strain P6497) TaxID=1094619 RepID=G4YHU4_PHYSP|nr:hypothetical protein PHYSODRAFT_252689 [Phytophthora sojae]EGZ29671.1 hypothetical protein PHYSODRAFT_252689 [Phytophthora sojae]|eukprot:XP_009516946.1 hypothetical protein PHYSODRAFT_252689 [Phytophthora sojae]
MPYNPAVTTLCEGSDKKTYDCLMQWDFGAGLSYTDLRYSKTVNFTLTSDDWRVYYPQIGHGLKKVAKDCDYVVATKPETNCDVYNETAAAKPLCATSTVSTGERPFETLEQPW